MTACEKCWTEANWRALTRGGFTADHYREVLAENEADHTTPADMTPAGTQEDV